jgi:CubicO group peptidase (beta-lactamase class C family)
MAMGRKRSSPASVIVSLAFLLFSGCQEVAGFKAKALSSNIFNSDRDVQSIERDELTILLGLQHAMPTTIFYTEKKVETQFFFSQAIAIHREGLGTTLLYEMTEEELMGQEVPDLTPFPPGQELLPWPTGDVMDDDIPPEVDPDRLLDALDFSFQEPIPGERNRRTRAVVVVYDGHLIAERYAEEDGFYQNTRQIGWSMTKSVVNALVGILVGRGELNLYEPASVPAWNSPSDPRNTITLDDLLRMTSGLRFVEEVEVLPMLHGTDDTGEYAANKPLTADPGTHWAYSSGTSNIVARVIKAEFGTLEENFAFPRRDLFDKLGMRSAIVEPDGSGTLVGSSYLWATPRDWARFGLLYLNDGIWDGERILPEGWIQYTTAPTAPSDGKYGAHFWINAEGSPYPNLPTDLFECRGWLGQRITIIPSKKLAVVRLGFNPNIKYGSGVYHEPEHWSNDYHEAFILKCLGAIDYQ